MPLTISLQPMTRADRDAMRRAGDFDGGFGRVVLALTPVAAGIAAAWWAFSVIRVNVLLAMGLLIGGTVVAVVGMAMLTHAGSMWSARRRVDRESREAEAGGRVEQWLIEADAAWSAPTVDEDAGAVLLRVEKDRFVYCNAPRVDETQDDVEDPDKVWTEFPGKWTIRRLPSPDGPILSAAFDPDRLTLRTLPCTGGETARLLEIAAGRSWSLLVIERSALPDCWRDCDADDRRQAAAC